MYISDAHIIYLNVFFFWWINIVCFQQMSLNVELDSGFTAVFYWTLYLIVISFRKLDSLTIYSLLKSFELGQYSAFELCIRL